MINKFGCVAIALILAFVGGCNSGDKPTVSAPSSNNVSVEPIKETTANSGSGKGDSSTSANQAASDDILPQ